MKLFYFRSSYGNFGDDINPYIWTKLIPDVIDGDDDAIFLGIGTFPTGTWLEMPLPLLMKSMCLVRGPDTGRCQISMTDGRFTAFGGRLLPRSLSSVPIPQ